MTCLIDRILSVTGMKLHTSILGTFLVYMYIGSMYVCRFSTFFETFPQKSPRKNFLKIGIHRAKVYTKNAPNIEECDFIPVPLRTLSIKQVLVVLY